MRHIIPISGKDSLATAIVQMAREPTLPYELMFNDVGTELPETYEWLSRVERELGKPIHRIGRSLEDIIDGYGILPAPKTRFCTREGKIEPMEEFIGDDPATIYFGIRADEDRVGYQSSRHNIHPKYPLVEIKAGLSHVYAIVDKFGLAPPTFFWDRLHREVIRRLDKQYHYSLRIPQWDPRRLVESLPRWAFDRLFAWRTRNNCYFCFFQAKWEWVGLLEHHPDLFGRAEAIENRVGNSEQKKPFTWVRDLPLSKIRRTKDKILARRVVQVIRFLKHNRIVEDSEDLLAVTSCGLFCGK